MTKTLIPQKKVNELFNEWSKLANSSLRVVDQRDNKFSFDFIVDQSKFAAELTRKITDLTIKKHPTGTISFTSHDSLGMQTTTLYKRFHVDFIDSANKKDTIEPEKLEIYINELIRIVKERT